MKSQNKFVTAPSYIQTAITRERYIIDITLHDVINADQIAKISLILCKNYFDASLTHEHIKQIFSKIYEKHNVIYNGKGFNCILLDENAFLNSDKFYKDHFPPKAKLLSQNPRLLNIVKKHILMERSGSGPLILRRNLTIKSRLSSLINIIENNQTSKLVAPLNNSKSINQKTVKKTLNTALKRYIIDISFDNITEKINGKISLIVCDDINHTILINTFLGNLLSDNLKSNKEPYNGMGFNCILLDENAYLDSTKHNKYGQAIPAKLLSENLELLNIFKTHLYIEESVNANIFNPNYTIKAKLDRLNNIINQTTYTYYNKKRYLDTQDFSNVEITDTDIKDALKAFNQVPQSNNPMKSDYELLEKDILTKKIKFSETYSVLTEIRDGQFYSKKIDKTFKSFAESLTPKTDAIDSLSSYDSYTGFIEGQRNSQNIVKSNKAAL
ncbi:MAG: hypothetical protein ACK4OM_07480 [Alphaproteobacteria bacterium]